MKTITSLVAVLALTLALTSSAFAQGASSEAYVDEGGQVVDHDRVDAECRFPDHCLATELQEDSMEPFVRHDPSQVSPAGLRLVDDDLG